MLSRCERLDEATIHVTWMQAGECVRHSPLATRSPAMRVATQKISRAADVDSMDLVVVTLSPLPKRSLQPANYDVGKIERPLAPTPSPSVPDGKAHETAYLGSRGNCHGKRCGCGGSIRMTWVQEGIHACLQPRHGG